MADLFDVPFLDITCVSRQTYGWTKRDNANRLPALMGRPRYRRRDVHASYLLTLKYEFTDAQYQEFQDFWWDELDAGLGVFLVRLMMDEAEFYNNNAEIYTAKATQSFTSINEGVGFWVVTLPIEIASGFRTNLYDCPTVYGGPISSPAVDDIWGGPIDALASDVIVPCPGVDPNG